MKKSLQTRASVLAVAGVALLVILATGCQQEKKGEATTEVQALVVAQEEARAIPTNTPPPTPVATAIPTLSPTAVPTETPAPAPTETPTPKPRPTEVPAPPTAVPTATAVPPAPTPAISDREALVRFANKFLEIDRQLGTAIDQFDATYETDLVKASDTFVKQVEVLLPRLDALVAPQVPYAQAFLDRYRTGAHLYYEGMMKITWAASDRNAPANVLPEAFNQLTTGDKNMEQAFWEFKAAIEKQGIRYNPKTGKFE